MRASFFVLTLGFLMGVLWRSFFVIGIPGVATILFVTACIAFLLLYSGFHTSVLYCVFGLLACILGIVRTEFSFQKFESGYVLREGETFTGTGTITSEADVRDDHTILTIKLDTESTSGETTIKMSVPSYPLYQYGERVTCSGMVHTPEAFETDSGRIFNYPGFLMKDGIHYELRQGDVLSLNENVGNPFLTQLLTIKARWLNVVSQIIPEPAASLLGGVVVGAKRSLGDEWLKIFRDTGIIHIVVLSGYNLMLVANSIVRATTFFPSAVRLGLGVLGITSFSLMVGPSATVVRAGCMAILGMLAEHLYRPYIVFRALIVAGTGMVVWNPFILAYDPGFQLSVIATIGLIFVSPLFKKYVAWVPEKYGMREIVASTFATQLTVLPLLLYQVGSVSLVALFVNVLVLPFVPFVMALGFLAGILGMQSTMLAIPFAWLAYILLAYIFWIVSLFAGVPFASVTLPAMPFWFLVSLYSGLFFVYARIQKNTRDDSGVS